MGPARAAHRGRDERNRQGRLAATHPTLTRHGRRVLRDACFDSELGACYNRAEASCAVPGGNVWSACAFVWASFARENWGNLGAGLGVDAQAITQVHIRPPLTREGQPGQSFQFSIDDVSYLQ